MRLSLTYEFAFIYIYICVGTSKCTHFKLYKYHFGPSTYQLNLQTTLKLRRKSTYVQIIGEQYFMPPPGRTTHLHHYYSYSDRF